MKTAQGKKTFRRREARKSAERLTDAISERSRECSIEDVLGVGHTRREENPEPEEAWLDRAEAGEGSWQDQANKSAGWMPGH